MKKMKKMKKKGKYFYSLATEFLYTSFLSHLLHNEQIFEEGFKVVKNAFFFARLTLVLMFGVLKYSDIILGPILRP
jgi:hypothetical protein